MRISALLLTMCFVVKLLYLHIHPLSNFYCNDFVYGVSILIATLLKLGKSSLYLSPLHMVSLNLVPIHDVAI